MALNHVHDASAESGHMAHLHNKTLEHYSAGRLTEAGIRRAEEHLIVCPSCRDRLDDFEVFLSSIRAAASATSVSPLTMTAGKSVGYCRVP